MGQGSTTQPVAIRGAVSAGNSSTATLGAAGVFTGTFEEVTNFAFVVVSIIADQASATNGLVFQWSSNGTDVDRTEAASLSASIGRAFALTVRARYFRIVYTNDGNAQGSFRLGTVYHQSGTGIITKPLGSAVADDNFGQLVQAVLTAKRDDGTYALVRSTNTDALHADEDPKPTFYAVFDRIAPAANKYMATLFNTSATRKVVVQRIWRYNWQIAAVAGANLEQYLARITACTVGTSVTIRLEDTNDALSAGITADTNSTGVTEDHVVKRIMATANEFDFGGQVTGAELFTITNNALVYERKLHTRGLVLRQNQGISVRNVTSSTVGTVSYVFEFTDEAT